MSTRAPRNSSKRITRRLTSRVAVPCAPSFPRSSTDSWTVGTWRGASPGFVATIVSMSIRWRSPARAGGSARRATTSDIQQQNAGRAPPGTAPGARCPPPGPLTATAAGTALQEVARPDPPHRADRLRGALWQGPAGRALPRGGLYAPGSGLSRLPGCAISTRTARQRDPEVGEHREKLGKLCPLTPSARAGRMGPQ